MESDGAVLVECQHPWRPDDRFVCMVDYRAKVVAVSDDPGGARERVVPFSSIRLAYDRPVMTDARDTECPFFVGDVVRLTDG